MNLVAILILSMTALSAVRAGVYPHYSLAEGDQDLRLHTGHRGTPVGRQAAFADVDGDGRRDGVFSLYMENVQMGLDYSDVSVLPGVPERRRGNINLVEARALAYTQLSAFAHYALQDLLDWNRDGRADFIFTESTMRVINGRSPWPSSQDKYVFKDAAVQWPTPETPRGWSVAHGDLNGDGTADVLAAVIGQNGATSLDVFLGAADHPATLLVSTGPVLRWAGAGGSLRGFGPVYDVNEDGYADVALSRGGGVEVWRGSANPPTSRDVGADTPSLRVQGGAGASLEYALSGDLNGDGRREMVVCSTGAGGTAWWSLDGALVGSATGTVAMTALGPRRLRSGGAGDSLEAVGDFDGDGRADLVWSSTATGVATRTGVYLSADQPGEGEWTGEPSFTIEGEAGEEDEYHLVDMDGDGKDDLWIVQKPGGGSYRWHVNLFYGFRPLKNPRVAVGDREEGSKRATLALTVEGDPAEMRLSGDIEDEDRDQWIPYAAKRRVRWTGNAGAKTVRVSYRTAEGRESAAATASVGAREEGAAVRSVTNRLIGGEGAVELDCRVTGGWLRATVRERGGGVVRRIYDGAAEGLTTVKWDGRNEGGGRVRPGVYAVTLEFDGNRETRRVLVEP